MDRTRLSRKRVVVAEPFADHGLEVLRAAGIEVASLVGRSRSELAEALADADGLIVRSETRVDRELSGKTLGIVGLGRIGGNVAARAKAFGMTIVAYDPYVTAARADGFDARLVDLETLLRASDIVTLHVPLTAQTLGMIDAQRLRTMRAHAYLINCARGGVVVEDDLLEALDAGVL